MKTANPPTIHGLPVMSYQEASAQGYESITVDIHAETEKPILAGVCQHRNPDQKVVVLTNYATNDIRRRCAELGSDAVFDKSNELEQLLEYCSDTTRGH